MGRTRIADFLRAAARLAFRAPAVHLGARWLCLRGALFGKPPATLNEKIRHHMAMSRDAKLTLFADKLAVRDFVAQRVGQHYLTELFSVHEDAAAFRANGVIPRRCAIKVTHGSGATILVDDAAARGGAIPHPRPIFPWNANARLHPDDIDPAELESLLQAWLLSDYSQLKAEWAYRNVPRRIIVEELLGTDSEPPPDFKFWCVNGTVRFIQIDEGRFGRHTRSLHAANGAQLNATIKYPAPSKPPILPSNFSEMRAVAEELAAGVAFVRVDLYSVVDRIVVGELTNYPEGGMARMRPKQVLSAFAVDWEPA